MLRMALFPLKAPSTKRSGHFGGFRRIAVSHAGSCGAPRRKGRCCAILKGFLYRFVNVPLLEESLDLLGVPAVATM